MSVFVKSGIVIAGAAAFLAASLLSAQPMTGKEPSTDGGSPQVRRLTEAQYRQVIADVFGADIAVGGRFDMPVRTSGLLAVGAGTMAITPSAFEQYDATARAIAAQVVDEKHRDFLIPCTPAKATAPDDACARQFLAESGRILYRRPLSKPELANKVEVARNATRKLGDFYTGLSYALAAMLTAPDFLFIADVPAKNGKDIDGFSKAARLSFLLWNTTPDEALLAAAERGELDTPAGLQKQVDRLLTSARLENGVRAFFSDMLGFETFAALAKDPLLYPAFGPAVADDAQEQALRTIVDVLLTRRGDYRELFTTRKTFLSGPLGILYNVPVASPGGWVPYEFPPEDRRAGLVTQISFVALHSHPGRSSPTLRGKAVRELLLCQKVPEPPANVNFALVQDVNNPQFKTARQRLNAHATEAMCAGCHKITDPIGLALENFDGAGQFRLHENGAAIDTTAEIEGKKVTDAVGVGQALYDNPNTAACLVSRVYAYATGRAPEKNEGAWMKYLQQDFAAAGYRVPDLLRRVATSTAFYKLAPPGAISPSSQGE